MAIKFPINSFEGMNVRVVVNAKIRALNAQQKVAIVTVYGLPGEISVPFKDVKVRMR